LDAAKISTEMVRSTQSESKERGEKENKKRQRGFDGALSGWE